MLEKSVRCNTCGWKIDREFLLGHIRKRHPEKLDRSGSMITAFKEESNDKAIPKFRTKIKRV